MTTGTRLMQPVASQRLLEVVWLQVKLETVIRGSGPPSRGTYMCEKEGKERRRRRSWKN